MLVTRNVVSRRATVLVATERICTSWPPLTSREMARSGRMVPPLGKSVYAVAISNGVASKTPSAIAA